MDAAREGEVLRAHADLAADNAFVAALAAGDLARDDVGEFAPDGLPRDAPVLDQFLEAAAVLRLFPVVDHDLAGRGEDGVVDLAIGAQRQDEGPPGQPGLADEGLVGGRGRDDDLDFSV